MLICASSETQISLELIGRQLSDYFDQDSYCFPLHWYVNKLTVVYFGLKFAVFFYINVLL